MLLIEPLRIGYQFVPKVASTSVFNWFYQACGRTTNFAPSTNKNYKRQFFKHQFTAGSIEAVRQAEGSFLRMAMTRDPVHRFLSMYGNKVIAKRLLSEGQPDSQRILDAGLRLDPQLEEFIQLLDAYLEASDVIHHHTRPQVDFLGEDFSIYDHLLDVSQSDRFCSIIRQYWRICGLHQMLSKCDDRLPRLQTAGPKIGLDGISRRSFEILLEYYQSDYDAIPSIDQDGIKAQYLRDNGGSKIFTLNFQC